MQWFLSPEGFSYRSRYTAVQDMIKRNHSIEDIEHMRELMILHEGWQRSELLPENWLFKVKCEGFTKDKKWYSSIHYFTDEGETIESMKNVLNKLKENDASMETIENCNQFIFEQKPVDIKYEWSDGDNTVPKGWKLRISESEAEWQWMLSPDGAQFRSRYTAVQHMIKKNYKTKEVEEMKELMIMHEGWQRSGLLPRNWLFKVKCEGFTKDKKWYSSIHYFTEDGETIESMKNVLKKLTESNASAKVMEDCNQFIFEQKPVDAKYEWNKGDETVPKGWKLRISDSEAEWQWMLSPDGCQFRSRYTAVQDMIKRKYKDRDIEEMKELMILHEGWQRSNLLPKNWLFKVVCEGFTKDKKWYSTIHYFSDQGESFGSMKGVLDKLKEVEVSSQIIENCKQFMVDQKPADVKYDWSDGDHTVPKGWKLRVSDGEHKQSHLNGLILISSQKI